MTLATTYDLVNSLIFLTAGGSGRVRQSLVDELDVRAGHRVLELGCGTGQVTERLLAMGADVVAVDRLPAMLLGAQRRAPTATLLHGDVLEMSHGDKYDRVVLSFVLHSLDQDERIRLLRRAAEASGADGRIGVLEWALPRGRLWSAAWRRFLQVLERRGTVQAVLRGALEDEFGPAGLTVERRRRVAGGRAQILILSRSDSTGTVHDGSPPRCN